MKGLAVNLSILFFSSCHFACYVMEMSFMSGSIFDHFKGLLKFEIKFGDFLEIILF